MKRELEHEEVKKLEFALLLELDKFCRVNHLRYYLAGGTLLGAVRHHGYIPWDDDIDVMMPRPDYDKMISLRKAYPFPENVDITYGGDGSFHNPYARFVDLRTSYEGKYAYKNLWIDIFPIDGLPDSVQESEKIYKRVSRLKKMLKLSWANLNVGKTRHKTVMKIVQPVFRAIGTDYFRKRLERIGRKFDYNSSLFAGSVTWGASCKGERHEKKLFEISEMMEFEGKMFPVMGCWKQYLEGMYGDYMTPPPEDKRTAHADRVWIEEPEEEPVKAK